MKFVASRQPQMLFKPAGYPVKPFEVKSYE
jgi:hypothetical protein